MSQRNPRQFHRAFIFLLIIKTIVDVTESGLLHLQWRGVETSLFSLFFFFFLSVWYSLRQSQHSAFTCVLSLPSRPDDIPKQLENQWGTGESNIGMENNLYAESRRRSWTEILYASFTGRSSTELKTNRNKPSLPSLHRTIFSHDDAAPIEYLNVFVFSFKQNIYILTLSTGRVFVTWKFTRLVFVENPTVSTTIVCEMWTGWEKNRNQTNITIMTPPPRCNFSLVFSGLQDKKLRAFVMQRWYIYCDDPSVFSSR